MFPIRDHNPSRRTPVVTTALIAANIGLFLATLPLTDTYWQMMAFYDRWALIPDHLTGEGDWQPLLTHMFLHGGLLHLAGNMLFLWIFGDNLEDELGPLGFFGFYLASGIGAGLVQVAIAPASPVPMVGASGAIAGVMGGYLLLFPKARVDILIFLIVIVRILPIPAWIILGLWFGFQVLSGLGSDPEAGGVAYWAHAGGFVVGLALIYPIWRARGGPAFWDRTAGHPPHPETRARPEITRIPRVPRR